LGVKPALTPVKQLTTPAKLPRMSKSPSKVMNLEQS